MKEADYKSFDELFNFDKIFNHQHCENYKIAHFKNGDNKIAIAAMGQVIDNIDISVKNDILVIKTIKVSEFLLASPIDISFDLKGIYDPEGIKAKLTNGILTVTVSLLVKKEKETKKIIITS